MYALLAKCSLAFFALQNVLNLNDLCNAEILSLDSCFVLCQHKLKLSVPLLRLF